MSAGGEDSAPGAGGGTPPPAEVPRGGWRKARPEERRARDDEFRRLWPLGWTADELARRFGVARNAVDLAVASLPEDVRERARLARLDRRAEAARLKAEARKAGVEARARARGLAREARDAEIRDLWSKGWRGTELARRHGLSAAKVSAIVAGSPREHRSFGPEDDARAEGSPPIPPAPAPPLPRRVAGAAPAGQADPRDRAGAGPTSVLGSAHGRAILDEGSVVEMRRLRRVEGWSTNRLAERFRVGRNTVCYALAGVTWRHVPGAIRGRGEGR